MNRFEANSFLNKQTEHQRLSAFCFIGPEPQDDQ